MTTLLKQTLMRRMTMSNIYYKGDLIPAEDWDYALSKPKTNASKKEPKKAKVELPQEVTIPEE